MNDVLKVNTGGGTASLTLNRPHVLNAFNRDIADALLRALKRADTDPQTKVVLITGAGRSFCAGADLKEAARQDTSQRNEWLNTVVELHTTILRMTKPVVARVHGHALGLGCSLAVACDLVICADNALLGYPEVEHGLVPGVSLAMLSMTTTARSARDLVLLAKTVDGPGAVRAGLASQAVPIHRLDQEVDAIVERLSSMSPDALRLSKRLVSDFQGMPLEERFAHGAEAVKIARIGGQARSRLAALAEVEQGKTHESGGE